ncbi:MULTISPECIES: hypothetical protein [unclassified Lysinibacillus]|uniref:hypothetical protein n=1 Tax=unclassified Lysinibacillus TaxID=2636778 RepID=UPI0037F88FE3
MYNFIASVVGLISVVMFVLFVVSIVKFKQKNKTDGKKFLKFTGLSFAIIMVLSLISSLFEEPTDSAQPEDVEKITASTDSEKMKVATITPEEFKQIETGMSYDQVKKIIGGTATNDKNFNESVVSLYFDGEGGVDEDSSVTIMFNGGKADVIIEYGLITKQEETKPQSEPSEPTYITEGEANAEKYPAEPGAMLYDKTESKFKGMNYYFKGELIGVKKLEGLFGNMEDALLIKNEQGYVMPVFTPHEIDASNGDILEFWGPLSGDGYAASDLGVNNVVGMTGAMNATEVGIH